MTTGKSEESQALSTLEATRTPAERPKRVGESVLWMDHFEKQHDVGMRHGDDGYLASATCHDCNVVYYAPESIDG